MKFILFLICILLAENALLTEMSRQNTMSASRIMQKSMRANASMLAAIEKKKSAPAGAAQISPPLNTAAEPIDPMPSILSVSSGNTSRPDGAALGEAIVLRVRSLAKILDRSGQEKSPLILYIDGMPLKGVGPSAIMPEKEEIAFTLLSNGPARALWDKYLQIRGRDHFFTQDIVVTMGLENGRIIAEVPPDVPNFSIVLIRRPIFYFCAVLAVLLLIIFYIVASRSDLLRDGGAAPASGRKPYSLSRVQMALWFFVVIVSFLLLWVETGRIDTMPFSVVVMLGISAATALGAALLDTDRRKAAAPEQSRDFLFDIISDEHGVCFHRFQMAGWTLVLTVVFLYTVFTELRMPDFDASVLLLMGISSGTYLGYKIPERYGLAAVHP